MEREDEKGLVFHEWGRKGGGGRGGEERGEKRGKGILPIIEQLGLHPSLSFPSRTKLYWYPFLLPPVFSSLLFSSLLFSFFSFLFSFFSFFFVGVLKNDNEPPKNFLSTI